MEGDFGYTQIPQTYDDDVFASKASEDLRKQNMISSKIAQRARDSGSFTEGAGCCQLWWEGYFTIMPEETAFVDVWDSIVIICLGITALYMPVEAAFLKPSRLETDWLMVMSHIVDFVFTCDIIFTFNVAYVETNTNVVTNIDMWVRTPRQIAAKYMAFPCSQHMTAGWFWPDVITVLPWDRLTKGHASARDVRMVRVLRLIRMFRLVRVIKLFKRAHTRSGFSFSTVKVLTCFCSTLLLIHWLACVWGHLGLRDVNIYEEEGRTTWLARHLQETQRSTEDVTTFEVYKISAYFITVVLTTVGFGDLAPSNQTEIITMIFTIFITGITWAYVMGTVVNVLSSFDKFGSAFNSSMDDINELMIEQKLPNSLRYRIRRHVHESFNVQRRLHHKPALQWLSDGLKGELAIEAGVDKVCHCIWYLRDLPQPVLTELADKFGGTLFSPNELIMDDNSLFVIVRGTCIKRAKMLGRDSVFGEDMILATQMLRDTAMPRTISFVEVMSLNKERLAETCLKFPVFDRRIRKAQIRLAVWRAFIRQAELYKREKERAEGKGKRSLWDVGYFTTADHAIDSPSQMRWTGNGLASPGRMTSPGGMLKKRMVPPGSMRPEAGAPQTRNGVRPGPGPTRWHSVGSAGSLASLGSISSQGAASPAPINGWTTSGSLQDTSKSVMVEVRRMHNLLKEVQMENRMKWEEFDVRFGDMENKVNAMGKKGINRKFWG